METTVKTAEFDLLAANYNEMFQSLIKAVENLHAQNKDALSRTQFATPEALRTAINSEISWTKQHLKKQDRIVWYLRWMRALFAHAMFRGNDFPEMKAKFVDPAFKHLQTLTGIADIENYRMFGASYSSTSQRLHTKLDHFLSLPIPAIQNTVFNKQTPDDLFTAFEDLEDDWKEQSKGTLVPHDNDELVIQFQDGWAWWKLGRGYCPEEAKAMGHCGNVNGRFNNKERILSLRRPVMFGKETRWEPYLTFILDGDGWLGEMKGRGNEKPAYRYQPYIITLLERTDLVRGVKGGGYLPSHNFSLSDLQPETQDTLEKLNPNLISIQRRLRQLNGKPDKDLLKRIRAVVETNGPYDDNLRGWVQEEWENPGELIENKLYGNLRESYRLYTGDFSSALRDYNGWKYVRQVLTALGPSEVKLINDWLTDQGISIAEREKYDSLFNFISRSNYHHQNPDETQTIAIAKRRLLDVWKAGITPSMRQNISNQIEEFLRNEFYSRKGLELIFDKNDFWNKEVKLILPLWVAAREADGGNESDDDENEDEDDWRTSEFFYSDPIATAYYNPKTNAALKQHLQKVSPEEQAQVKQMDEGFREGDRQPLMNYIDSILPGTFDEAKKIAWDADAARKAVYVEFAQETLPFDEPKKKRQHASLLLQKDASFEIVAANYEEMFKNVLDLSKTNGWQDFPTLVSNEITWAKQKLKKQDRIVWWLRWYRLTLLGDMSYRAERVKDHLLSQELRAHVDKPEAEQEQQIQKSPELVAAKEKYNTIQRYLQGELKALTAKTGQPIHGGITGTWFARTHRDMEHFLSLPVAEIINLVWDKQTPKDLLDTFAAYEKEWQDRTKGMLRPNLTPNEYARPSAEVQGLQEKLDELQSELERLQAKKDVGETLYEQLDEQGNVIAQSTRPRAGYTERVVTPQEKQQEITETEAEIAQVTKEFNEKNVPEVDTVFVQFQDGWAWWKLSRAYCSEEAKAMGHCGNVEGQNKTDERILSLRKPVKVGNETYWEPHLTFILEPNNYLGEMKGKANQKPAPQYHKYIISLLEDPRIKGIRGGGYAPERNFALKDLTKEQQEALIAKNPNLNSITHQLAKNGPTPEIIERIADVLGWGLDDHANNPYDPELRGWVTEKWKTVDDLVQDKGDDVAKYISKQMNGDGDFYDYSDGIEISNVLDSMDAKQEETLKKFILTKYPEDVQEWKEQQIEDGDEEPDWNDVDLSEFIDRYEPDEVQSSLFRAYDTGARYGAESEMFEALSKAIEQFSIEDTGEILNLPRYKTKEGKEGITWDSPVALYLPIQAAAELADRGEPFQYYEDDDDRSKVAIKVPEPHYGWSGWDDDGFNDAFEEEFGHAMTPEEEAAKQKEYEAEAKRRPDLIPIRQDGKIVSWQGNPKYKGPKLGPGGVEVDDQGNPIKKKKKAPRKKTPGAKKKKKQRASMIAAMGGDTDWMKDEFHFNKKHNELLEKLKALPYASEIKVFGSAARNKEKPGDIDLVIDLRGKGKHSAWTDLLTLAREYYGSLDPFIIADDGIIDGKPIYRLWARDDQAWGWIPSRNKAKMLKNMEEQSVPLTSIKPFKTGSVKIALNTNMVGILNGMLDNDSRHSRGMGDQIILYLRKTFPNLSISMVGSAKLNEKPEDEIGDYDIKVAPKGKRNFATLKEYNDTVEALDAALIAIGFEHWAALKEFAVDIAGRPVYHRPSGHQIDLWPQMDLKKLFSEAAHRLHWDYMHSSNDPHVPITISLAGESVPEDNQLHPVSGRKEKGGHVSTGTFQRFMDRNQDLLSSPGYFMKAYYERGAGHTLEVVKSGTAAVKKARDNKPVIDAHRSGTIMWIDWMWVPQDQRGKGVGRKLYEDWEKNDLPDDIILIRLQAADAGDGPAAPFWEKMGFDYVYDRETGNYELDNQMWKGVNDNGTPKSLNPHKNEEENDE